ncbi:MAG: ribose-phosphate pyrophosphokinase [Gammaproteobacteria bacterium]|jgi:ribose-phosphate pyrophosphokinase|uniref:Ribose-phosphate pyrophosphokinase n=1 Tax=SAR86 cluster bacterium TaxID=2030880 RepID=A0A520N1M4_9GAMM|nr:ribose-phosphate pyrophosphokinase [Gammaproteobacteria bacterium]MBA4730340.1 ribose-phosphate pyrophosphokinase [SAR86 cluster bacterium]RPG34944.1 MAG: ribose-phosphate pyrophosphokinase [Gammaproteobacteria bacterium TMED193]MAV83937.1 ribose-phosphate pyrophosphokinase [Gammaproteobacteria bacterium]MBH36651.1 ribose-phosphate pyrophosphokinase [Gammaproteobacteria bacterium]|tara:strand:+ start:61980 stop:62927 length:948 start_codon:yes stop_codon:yes gene_type:complete
MDRQLIFSGSSNIKLSQSISKRLNKDLGDISLSTFSDGEISVEINENVRGKDTFVIQSTNSPAEKNLMELILISDALKRASARSITAVMPYFGYARQDRRVRSARVPISARVIAEMLESVGISRIITLDIHSEQIQGFFSFPVDNIYTSNIMSKVVSEKYNVDELQVVSPDTGGVLRARSVAKTLGVQDLAIIDKRRERANESEVLNIIGDVDGKVCIVPDDMIDTAGTLSNASHALKSKGAKEVIAFITHPVLSGNAIENINSSAIDKLIVSNSIDIGDKLKKCPKIDVFDISDVLSEAIKRITTGDSISELFR